MELFDEYFLWLYETTGWNFVIFYDQFEWNRFYSAIWVTIELIVACLIFSLVIGVIGAWMQGAHSKIIRVVMSSYVALFRNTPPFVQILFFYFVLGALVPSYDAGGYQVSYITNFGWAVISLSFFAGAFNVEIFRSGIEAIPDSTIEAAEALGYNRIQIYRQIVLPLAMRVCLPSLNNNLVNLVKTTTLAYGIAVPEMMYTMNQVWSDNVNVTEMMIVLFIFYVGLVSLLVWAMHRFEAYLKIPGVG